ncbi:hypothetical protein PVNG_02458 [Plasmodium vivax North Korean]|uniref:50S ribosomal protein L22 n=1 Tax=Plasmodium vivax North Korean TaxID=1035514 RepID=A0A0J9TKU1_PLAVI|nr:hypothetical protein PVNG_02458 [Plasmodium vivax North Korean]
MVVRVVHRNVKISPQKAVLACRLIHRKSLTQAYEILRSVSDRKMVKLLYKLLLEASANAVNNYALRGDDLLIDKCVATKGSRLKRSFIRAKGRTDMRIRKFSHLSVTLIEGERRPKRVAKSTKKLEEGVELDTKKIEEYNEDKV